MRKWNRRLNILSSNYEKWREFSKPFQCSLEIVIRAVDVGLRNMQRSTDDRKQNIGTFSLQNINTVYKEDAKSGRLKIMRFLFTSHYQDF